MAIVTWRQGNCRIVRLDEGDLYANENGHKSPIIVKQFLLLAGSVKMDITPCGERGDHVRISIPSDTEHGIAPIILNAYKPCPDEWWDVICKRIDPDDTIPDIKEIEFATFQPQLSVIDEPMFTLKDIIITGLTVAAAVFGIMR